jgi:hypothetical protein
MEMGDSFKVGRDDSSIRQLKAVKLLITIAHHQSFKITPMQSASSEPFSAEIWLSNQASVFVVRCFVLGPWRHVFHHVSWLSMEPNADARTDKVLYDLTD